MCYTDFIIYTTLSTARLSYFHYLLLSGSSTSYYTKLNNWCILLAVKFYMGEWVPRSDTRGAYRCYYAFIQS